MSKIICDVCGTRYPDSSNQCPICGCIRNAEQKTVETDVPEEEVAAVSHTAVRGGRFSKSNVRKRNKNQTIYEESEVPAPAPVSETDGEEDDSFEEFETGSRRKKNVFVNILLFLVIVALLAVIAYIFLQYVMPNALGDKLPEGPTEATAMTDAPTEEAPTEAQQTEAAQISCEQLVLDVTDVILTEEGQMYLLNVQTLPEDTTDTIMYISSNEDVATVNEEGRVTAIGEGSVVISIFCGEQQTECNVICTFATEAPTEAATEAPAEGETEAPAEGETEAPAEGETEAPAEGETEAPAEGETEPPVEETTGPLKDVVLSVKTSDMTFRARGQQAVIKLTCDLTNQEVTWTSANENVATVDENGVITRIAAGTTIITGQYGDQKVEIIVRCPRG